jgi:hypothetical protein
MYVDRRLWRTGRSLGRTVYAQAGTGAAKGDQLLGLMETTEIADYVVELHNRDLATALRSNTTETSTIVHFDGGPWNYETATVDNVVGPVFSAQHNIGRNYWLDTASDPPTYRWRAAP